MGEPLTSEFERTSVQPILLGLHRRHMGDGLLMVFVITLESAPESHTAGRESTEELPFLIRRPS